MDVCEVLNHCDCVQVYQKKLSMSTHTSYQNSVKKRLKIGLRKNKAKLWVKDNLQALLSVYCLNLEPIQGKLASLYAPDGRGKPPYDPQVMLRSFILMAAMKVLSITQWVKELRSHDWYAIFCGISTSKTPSVGAHYDFLKRLENGAYQRSCLHYVPPTERRKARCLRHYTPQSVPTEEEYKSLDQDVVEEAAEEAMALESQPRIRNLQTLLNDLLMDAVVLPSAQAGLLTDLTQIRAGADGSTIKATASPYGKPDCDCRKLGIYKCEHTRRYSEPDASWGWDNRLKCCVYGYRYFQIVSGDHKHNSPLYLTLDSCGKHEALMALTAIDDYSKQLSLYDPSYRIASIAFDGIFDIHAFYRYLVHKRIKYTIPLRKTKATCFQLAEGYQCNREGCPLCPSGQAMRYHCTDKQGYHVYTCPVKRLARREGKKVYVTHEKECQNERICEPDSQLGPIYHIGD